MAQEPFVLQSVDRALEWVELCSKGIGVPRATAASMLASLCGFGSWDVMAYAMEQLPPSIPDEELDRHQVAERSKTHIRELVGTYDLDPGLACYLLAHLPPTSKRSYKAFEIGDAVEVADHLESGMRALDPAAMDEASGSDDTYERYFVPPLEPYRALVAMELSRETTPMGWIPIFEMLGWDYELCNDGISDLDEATYKIFDDEYGEVLVYLSPLADPPTYVDGPPIERATRVQRALCLGDFFASSDESCGHALLLKRWPLVKEVDGQLLCHLGSVYSIEENGWTELLFNRACTSFATLLDLNSQVVDINKGSHALIDVDGVFSEVAMLSLSDISPDEVDKDASEMALTWIEVTNIETGWALRRFVGPSQDDD